MEMSASNGGHVRRLMANAIKNYHFVFWTLPLAMASQPLCHWQIVWMSSLPFLFLFRVHQPKQCEYSIELDQQRPTHGDGGGVEHGWCVCVCISAIKYRCILSPFTIQHIYVGWFLLGQMETHRLLQILLSLVKSTLIQCPLITFCSSTETEYCPRRRKKRFISGPNSSDEGRSDEDNVKHRTRAKSEISSYSRLR